MASFPIIKIGDSSGNFTLTSGNEVIYTDNNGMATSSSSSIYAPFVYTPTPTISGGHYSVGSALGVEIPFPEDSRVVDALGEEIKPGDIILCSKMSSEGFYAKSWLGQASGELLPCLVWKICCYKNSLAGLSVEICLHYFNKDAEGNYGEEPLNYSHCHSFGPIFSFDDLIKVCEPEFHMHLPKFAKVMQHRFSFLEDEAAYLENYTVKVPVNSFEPSGSGINPSWPYETYSSDYSDSVSMDSMRDYFTSSQFLVSDAETGK